MKPVFSFRIDDRQNATERIGGQEATVTGRYIVDEIELAGPGTSLVVRARGTDMKRPCRRRRLAPGTM